jgi:hypothetical protein
MTNAMKFEIRDGEWATEADPETFSGTIPVPGRLLLL